MKAIVKRAYTSSRTGDRRKIGETVEISDGNCEAVKLGYVDVIVDKKPTAKTTARKTTTK